MQAELDRIRRPEPLASSHEAFMRLAIEQAELARGATCDNPWVGCVIVAADGHVLGRGFTQGPGEHHAEISAAENAAARGYDINGATLYSTLEPCSFHGRTAACAHAIVARGLRRVVIGLRDPHPRVDGVGAAILRAGGLEVVEGVRERDVRRQLASWILRQHPREVFAYVAAQSSRLARAERLASLVDRYGLPACELATFLEDDASTGNDTGLLPDEALLREIVAGQRFGYA